jgi:HTH-type transcriptional regulator/antitoxin HigA
LTPASIQYKITVAQKRQNTSDVNGCSKIMTKNLYSFTPTWISPPGETIADLIKEEGWSQADLARRLGYTLKDLGLLIDGKAPITEETALKLENVLGSTAGFWLRREALYRAELSSA